MRQPKHCFERRRVTFLRLALVAAGMSVLRPVFTMAVQQKYESPSALSASRILPPVGPAGMSIKVK